MARRRRRRGFGAAPKEHIKVAREAAKSARWHLKEARAASRARACYKALDALTTANRMSAVATQERRGAGRGRAFFQAETLRAAMNRFAQACIPGGVPYHGKSRRESEF